MATGGTDLMAPDPDACLFFKGGYYDRVRELIEGLVPQVRAKCGLTQ